MQYLDPNFVFNFTAPRAASDAVTSSRYLSVDAVDPALANTAVAEETPKLMTSYELPEPMTSIPAPVGLQFPLTFKAF